MNTNRLIVAACCLLLSFAYTEDWLQLQKDGDFLCISTKEHFLRLNTKRNYVLEQYGTQKDTVPLLRGIEIAVSEDSKNVDNDRYIGNKVTSAIWEQYPGERRFVVTVALTNSVLKKSWVFYENQPYIRMMAELSVQQDFHCKRVMTNIVFGADFNYLVFHEGGEAKYQQNKKASWFNIPRDEKHRWISVTDRQGGSGVAVIGANPWDWMELSGLILCSARKDSKGYTSEPGKWMNKSVYAGDVVRFDFFIAPFSGEADAQADRLQKLIAPQL